MLVAGLCAAAEVDSTASQIGFTLKTRWGQSLEGVFPSYRGEVLELADGRHQVRLLLDARAVEIVGHPGYTRFARGGGFFDASHYPEVSFVSEPYSPETLRAGGQLAGQLKICGVAHREVFTVQPAACAQPGIDCDAVASGSIRRSHYGMTRWNLALSGDVLFTLRIRTRAGRGP